MPADHIQLRPIKSEDLPTLYQHQLDPEANAVAVANPRNLNAFNEHWAKVLADERVVARAIVVGGVVVGNISCFQMDGVDSVGYWIAREHWGRGIATRALALLLEEVATRPLHARVARSNAGSIRVLERCGFELVRHEMSPGDDRFPACEEAIFKLT